MVCLIHNQYRPRWKFLEKRLNVLSGRECAGRVVGITEINQRSAGIAPVQQDIEVDFIVPGKRNIDGFAPRITGKFAHQTAST